MRLVSLGQFEQILPSYLLDQFAIEYHVDRCNHVRLPGQAVFASLLDTLLNNPVVALRAFEDTYTRKTGISADHSSFGKRLATIPAPYFQAIFEYLYDALAHQMKPGEAKALRVRRVDATTVTLSAKLIGFGILYTNTGCKRTGKGHRAIKTVFSLSDEGLPRFLRLAKAKEENSDAKALARAMQEHLQPNDLFVFDAGCHDRYHMLALHEAGAYFVTPHSTQTLNVSRTIWQADPEALRSEAPGKRDPQFQLTCVEQAAFGNKTDKNQPQWSRMPLVVIRGLRWDQRAKQWKEMILLTNLPLSEDDTSAGTFHFEEIAELYRRRWDIETFFKCIKQHLSYAHIVSRTENGIEVMIYMTLIAALLMIWYKRLTHIDRGWRSVKFWLANDIDEWTQDILCDAMITRTKKRKRSNLTL
jgi:hypothetical protein